MKKTVKEFEGFNYQGITKIHFINDFRVDGGLLVFSSADGDVFDIPYTIDRPLKEWADIFGI